MNEDTMPVEPKHYTMQAEPGGAEAATGMTGSGDGGNNGPGTSGYSGPSDLPALSPAPVAPTAQQLARWKWFLQLEQRRQNPTWMGRKRPPVHLAGEKVTVIHRGSHVESSRRKARRTLGTLSGRQWVKARKLIRRMVRAQDHQVELGG